MIKANNIYKRTKIWGKHYEKQKEKSIEKFKKEAYKEVLNDIYRIIKINAKKGITCINYWIDTNFAPWYEIAELVDLKLVKQGFSVTVDEVYTKKRTISWEKKI